MRARTLLLCLTLAACGDDDGANQFQDGGNQDGDMGDDGTPQQPVTVVITTGGAGIENIEVYFHTGDGTLIGAVPTDVNGVAAQMMPAGGYVTVVDPFESVIGPLGGVRQEQLVTFADVQPGDRLLLPNRGSGGDNTIRITAPADVDSDYYYVHSTGKAYTSPFQINETPLDEDIPVLPAAMYDVIVVGESGRYIGPTRGAPVNGVFEMSGGFATMAATPVTLTNLDDAILDLQAMEYFATSLGVVYSAGELAASRTPGSDGVLTIPQPAFTDATRILELDAGHQANLHGTHHIVQWKPEDEAATFDYANTLLAPYTAEASYDVPSRVLTWSEGAGVTADAVLVGVRGYRGTGERVWNHVVIAPRGTSTTLTLPQLPAPIDVYNFVLATDDTNVTDLTSYKVPGGWNAIRQGAFAAESLGHVGFAVGTAFGTIPASGQALINRYDEALPARTAPTRSELAPPARRHLRRD